MTPIYALTIALTGLIFIAWSFLMFWTLFTQRRRAAARTGKAFPNTFDTLTEWKHWWRSPELARQRRILISLTLALLLCIALMLTLAPIAYVAE